MKLLKKSVALLLVATMLCAIVISTAVSASAATPLVNLCQTDSQWKAYYYGGRTLSATGCGIFSLVNAVGYLTGKRMDVVSVASWAYSIGAYGASGTYRTALYPRVQAKYGGTYGFTVDCGSGNTGYWSTAANATLKKHLANGGVAIGHVPGHFIALVGYDYNTNKFHVYDSAPSSARGTNSNRGNVWVTQSRLSTGKLDLDWFCLISATGKPATTQPTVTWTSGNYQMLGAKYLRDSASTSSNTLVTVPKGEVMQVFEVVNGKFGRTQYGDYKGYILLDEDTKRIGAVSNGATAITSSDTRYLNAGYTATWEDIAGAAGYKFKIVELAGEPDPGNANEAANGRVIYDQTSYMNQTVSYTIPAGSLTNGKYLKIAVQTCFPNNVSYWTVKYVTCSDLPFNDVPMNSWYYDEVLYSYKKNYISGMTDHTFEPNGQATRAQMAVFAYRLAGSPEVDADIELPFSDVPDGAWYINELKWCYANGIVKADDKYRPNDSVSREVSAVYFYRLAQALNEDTTVNDFFCLINFDDSESLNESYYEEMTWAVEKSLIQGYDNKLSPKDPLTRAQVATLMYNFESYITAESSTPDSDDTPVG